VGAGGGEGELIGLIAAPGLAGAAGAGFPVLRRLDVREVIFAIGPEDPLGEIQNREAAAARGIVAEAEAAHFDGVSRAVVVQWDEHG